jgi:hypothetical protein
MGIYAYKARKERQFAFFFSEKAWNVTIVSSRCVLGNLEHLEKNRGKDIHYFETLIFCFYPGLFNKKYMFY